MTHTIRDHVIVKPGGRIELIHPDLPAGIEADVTITFVSEERTPLPLSAYFGRAKGCHKDAAEVETELQAERDSWDF